MKKLIKYFAVALCLSSNTLHADGIALELGLHFGGDELASATFVGGGTESVKAGELLSASAGYAFDIDEDIMIRTLFGIKADLITAENGDITFIRLPLDIILFNKGENVSAGIGITYHLSPELELSGAVGNATIEFDDALGFIAEIDYRLGERGYLGLKFTSIDYEINTALGSAEVSGNSIGIVLGVGF